MVNLQQEFLDFHDAIKLYATSLKPLSSFSSQKALFSPLKSDNSARALRLTNASLNGNWSAKYSFISEENLPSIRASKENSGKS